MASFKTDCKALPSYRMTQAPQPPKEFTMSGIILLILVLVPIIEITLFIQMGGVIGPGWTTMLVIATAMIGVSAMRRQGMATLASAQLAQ
ncbi:FxsA family protein, partial [Alphaproteobacteria bacterium]|nr:FxsA family protein [Alphaproteobacteria bacterium]